MQKLEARKCDFKAITNVTNHQCLISVLQAVPSEVRQKLFLAKVKTFEEAVEIVQNSSVSYERNYFSKVENCQNMFSKCAAGLVETETNESYVTKLLTYFKSRA